MRVAIIGLGNQGRKRQGLAGERVVATVDPYNADASCQDIRDLPLGSFDAAFVCTPDDAKFAITEYLLTNAKHVLVEKPFIAAELPCFHLLRDLAIENRAVCYTAYNHRFEPHIAKLKDLLDSGELGRIYLAKFFYGNGTARDVRNSPWRDRGMGVLSDLGSHLLDLSVFLFGDQRRDFQPWSLSRFENIAFDHALFGSVGAPTLEMEVCLLAWRNAFSIEVFGEKGSAHIDGLCKWGPSTFVIRERILPSGKPDEEKYVLECADPTWELEQEHFIELCRLGYVGLEKDQWIYGVLSGMLDGVDTGQKENDN